MSRWNSHQDRCYLKRNKHNVAFLIVGKKRTNTKIDWAAFLIDPATNEPDSNEPYFYHEHKQSLYFQIDNVTPAKAASLLGGFRGECLSPQRSTVRITNNISIDARTINVVNRSHKDCVDSIDWARIQCERMGWHEPPQVLVNQASDIFNKLGSEDAVEHIMLAHRRCFGLNNSSQGQSVGSSTNASPVRING